MKVLMFHMPEFSRTITLAHDIKDFISHSNDKKIIIMRVNEIYIHIFIFHTHILPREIFMSSITNYAKFESEIFLYVLFQFEMPRKSCL